MTSQQNSRSTQPVEYKGEPLDAARGPGLGCFWFQMALLVVLLVITPLSATDWGWPIWATSVLFVVMLVLLLISGQTMIFLLRLVAAGRGDGRRRPLASPTPTVGEIEDEAPADAATAGRADEEPPEGARAHAGEAPADAATTEPADEAPPAGAPELAAAEAADQAALDGPSETPGTDAPGMRQ